MSCIGVFLSPFSLSVGRFRAGPRRPPHWSAEGLEVDVALRDRIGERQPPVAPARQAKRRRAALALAQALLREAAHDPAHEAVGAGRHDLDFAARGIRHDHGAVVAVGKAQFARLDGGGRRRRRGRHAVQP